MNVVGIQNKYFQVKEKYSACVRKTWVIKIPNFVM